MPKIQRSILVNYTAEQMYNLVNDFERYSEFLPWCSQATKRSVSDKQVEGTIHFSHGMIQKSFTTLNSLEPNQSIYMQLVEGPFKHFQGAWRFNQRLNDCELRFDLEFEFASALMAMAAGPVFQTAIGSMMEAFIKRARELYD